MITEIFAKRYKGVLGFNQYHAEKLLGPIFVQAAHIFFDDLRPALDLPDDFFREVNQQLARELGLLALSFEQRSHLQTSAAYLVKPYNLWDDSHGDADHFVKTRLSLLELLFRKAEKHAQLDADAANAPRGLFARMLANRPSKQRSETESATKNAINELNKRLQIGGVGLVYHNGLIQIAADDVTETQTAKPFWSIVSEARWTIVDQEMKEALDRLDRRQPDAATYATKALESAIKIISDDNGWSSGRERGAINYIENLQSDRSGRFIAAWEAEALKAIFKHLRNPYSHGGGSAPPDPLSDFQQTWTIENCMAWIKSLVRRPPPRA